MLSILHRYVLRELVQSFLVAFLALMTVMLLGAIFQPLRHGISLGTLLRFLPFALPYSLAWVIPASLLTACLMTYGRLSADNELMATAACGLPLRYMCYPALVVAILASAAALPLNDWLIPYCRARSKSVLRDEFMRRPFSGRLMAGHEILEIGTFKVYAESIDEEKQLLHKVLVMAPREDDGAGGTDKRPPPKDGARVEQAPHSVQVNRADVATYQVDLTGNTVSIVLHDAEYCVVTPEKSATVWLNVGAAKQKIAIPVEGSGRPLRSKRSELYTSELWQKTAKLAPQLAKVEGQLAAVSSQLARPPQGQDKYLRKREKRLKKELAGERKRLARVLTEIRRREGLALSNLALCLVGVPLGVMIRRESKLASFAVAVFVFLLLYALLVGGEGLATEGKLSPKVALWGPDALMGLLGIGLLLHTFRR